jgi:hypothetical protein
MCHLAVLFLRNDSPGRLDGFWRQFAEIYDDFGCRGHVGASVDFALGLPRSGSLVVSHEAVIVLSGSEARSNAAST